MSANWDRARTIADAVLYEGYLLYPYRATSSKNQSRWQFGRFRSAGAADAGIGEDDSLAAQFLVDGAHGITLVVRFLQLQHRGAERDTGDGRYRTGRRTDHADRVVAQLGRGGRSRIVVRPLRLRRASPAVDAAGDGAAAAAMSKRSRAAGWCEPGKAIRGELTVGVEHVDDLQSGHRHRSQHRASIDEAGKDWAIAKSMIGTHVIAEVVGGEFVSLLDPPDRARDRGVADCQPAPLFPGAGRPAR